MEKKRSAGIVVVGIVIIFLNLLLLLFFNSIYEGGKVTFGKFNILFLIEIIIFMILTTFFAIRLFYLKEYARQGLIVFMCLGILSDIIRFAMFQLQISKVYIVTEYVRMRTSYAISLIIALVIYLLIIYFLTRDKVKEQFK
jgi:hypothetical protein